MRENVDAVHRAIRCLCSRWTSRANKLALVADYRSRGLRVEWIWMGEPWKSRMAFRFLPDDHHWPADSYEEDVLPLLESR